MTQKKKTAAKKTAAKKTTAAKKPAAKKTAAPPTEPAVDQMNRKPEPQVEPATEAPVDPIVELLRKPLTTFVAGTRGYRELITRFNSDFKTQWNPWKVPAPTLYLIYKKMRAHYGIDD